MKADLVFGLSARYSAVMTDRIRILKREPYRSAGSSRIEAAVMEAVE